MTGAVFPFRGKITFKSKKFLFLTFHQRIETQFLCGNCVSINNLNFIVQNYPRVQCKFCKTINIMPYRITHTVDGGFDIDIDLKYDFLIYGP